MSEPIRLDLGCGRQRVEGYVGIDSNPKCNPDIEWNLERGLPKRTWVKADKGNRIELQEVVGDTIWESVASYKMFDDNSVDEIRVHHILEHIRNLDKLMEEMWDALKPDGILKVYVPNAECPRAAWGDPGHVRAFSVLTMGYYTTESQAAFPITEKSWKILDGYPKVNGKAPDDLWEIEWWMTPDK